MRSISKQLRSAVTARFAVVTLSLGAIVFGLQSPSQAAETAIVIPPPATDNPKAAGALQTAVLAGGCFWGVQGVFEHVRGVHKVLAGYAGGEKKTATYDAVSSGSSGHAESVQISFDPQEVSFGEILRVYFSVAHDPTQLNRQGPDHGTQYRSQIFYVDDKQKAVAEAYIAQLDKAKTFPDKIVTRVEPLSAFYAAEKYHQDFLIKNPTYPYIVYNDLPKIQNLKKLYAEYYRGKPATVE
jgi:peptide-methionine (S)-S-oxide reductase